jgi:hypothetical protein
MVLFFLAIYYFVAGKRKEFWPFFRVTVFTRASALVFVIVFVVLNMAKPLIILFVIVDAIGAVWTFFALRKDNADGLLE